MKKHFVVKVLSLLLALSLAGCGSKSAGDSTSVDTPEEVQIEESSTDYSEESEETQIDSNSTDESNVVQTDNSGNEDEQETPSEIVDENTEEVAGVDDSEQDIEEELIPDETDNSLPEENLSDAQLMEKEQLNSFSMMYYLAITAEEIRTSKNNRLILDDIYTSLLNDINPGSVDDITQDHLQNLRDIIKSYLSISVKRERLQYIYNQNKAAAMRSAIPNPIAVLSMANSLDWKRLAVATVYAIVDSYSNYKDASQNADQEFLMSGWELDDEEVATVQKNRDRAFDYMVDMVQKYDLDGMLTLNEKAIEKFATICNISSVPERISRLESEEETYRLLGNYWLELADCYFERNQYEKCLECVEKYNELSTGIYRKDFNYVQILPKAIVAAQNVYTGERYISSIGSFASAIIRNTSTEDWSTRYFVAQVYLDLYSKTNNQEYLNSAYNIARSNVTVLLEGQRALNKTFLNDIEEVVVEEPDYRFLTEKEKKEKEQEYKAEKKRAKKYTAALKEARKTELPSLYEPLVVNCELLFALADKMSISPSEKSEIEAILKTESGGTFLSKPINDKYSFSKQENEYSVKLTEDGIDIPAVLLTSESEVTVTVKDGSQTTTFDDCVVKKVDRKGSDADTFTAHYSSKKMKKYKWTNNSKVTITIKYHDAYDEALTFKYSVTINKKRFFGETVVFEKE